MKPKRDTARFLALMNAANNKIAEQEAQERAEQEAIGTDQFRIQRDAERRDKQGGTLRAREHPRSRPIKSLGSVFGHVDLR